MGKHAKDDPFPAASGILSGHMADDGIPVDGSGQGMNGNEDILFSFGIDHKSIAVLVRVEPSRQLGKTVGKGQAAVGKTENLVGRDQTLQ